MLHLLRPITDQFHYEANLWKDLYSNMFITIFTKNGFTGTKQVFTWSLYVNQLVETYHSIIRVLLKVLMKENYVVWFV